MTEQDREMLRLARAPDDLPDIAVDVADIAGALQVHPRTVQRWILAGKLRGRRKGGVRSRWRVRMFDLAGLWERHDMRMRKHLIRAGLRGAELPDQP